MDCQIFRVRNQNAMTVLLFLRALPDWIDKSLSWAPQLTVFPLSASLILCSQLCRICSRPLPPPIFTSYRWGSCVIGVGVAVVCGEIRAYGREIRGEISQHLAAHMHTFPAGRWSLRSEHGGHERGISTVAKGRRFFHYFSLSLLIWLSLCPYLSFSLLLTFLHLCFFLLSYEVSKSACVWPLWSRFCLRMAGAKCPTDVKRLLKLELFGCAKKKNTTCWEGSSKGPRRGPFD